MNVKDLNPRIVWKFFHEITQVPRPSKKEAQIIRYLESFAKVYNRAIKKDAAGNILISKPATPGYESRPVIVLQSHVDMVCEKNSDKVFNFEKDPIKTVVDGDWLRADGTTLGADNGIGMAASLAVLASEDIKHGAVECLFTVDEETGLSGAKALAPGFMTGRMLLNLDSEDEGEIFIGCAGGKDTRAELSYRPEKPIADFNHFRIGVKGLNGGHSGSEIHAGLGNANKLLARYLFLLWRRFYFTLSSFDGGNLRNAIPREACAVIGLHPDDQEGAWAILNRYIAQIENELKKADPKVEITKEPVAQPARCIDTETLKKLIYSLNACPHGVIAMSHDMEGLVETSTNLASVKTSGDKIIVETSQRSSIESSKEAVANQVASAFLLAEALVTHSDGYPGWAPNPASPLLKAAKETYRQLFGKEPAVKAIHAGLECGLFLEKYPYLDMISFGPTLRDVHSPNERIFIPSVELWWKHLLALLQAVQ
jgi:dipeptidase D